MKNEYDLIIIGSGPAGLSAATYSARYKLNTLVIGKLLGGTAGGAYEVHNFPSYEKIMGYELMQKMIAQVKSLNIEIKNEEIMDIQQQQNGFEVLTKKEKYFAKKVILATGTERTKINLPMEKELTGRGVSYCATCDGVFYKDKIVAVVGGSDSALMASLLLAKFAKKVYIIYRQDSFFRGEPATIKEIKENKKIETIFNANILKLTGKDHLEEIEYIVGKERKKLKLDGIFFEIGSTPGSDLAKKLKVKLINGQIKVDNNQKTNIPGFFAAGDVTNNPLKQIVTACAEGAIATYSAYQELDNKK